MRRHPDNPVPDIFSLDERKKIKEKTVYVVSGDECPCGVLEKYYCFFPVFSERFQRRFKAR